MDWFKKNRKYKNNIDKYNHNIISFYDCIYSYSLFDKRYWKATSEFKGLGISALLPALIYAIFNTSLPEEIFFRGFLLKRLSNKFGFRVANVIQSTIFGLLHGIMFFSLVGIVKAMIIILLTGIIAYAMGYVNEKKANGSILPSWFIHALSNIFASIIAMFSII